MDLREATQQREARPPKTGVYIDDIQKRDYLATFEKEPLWRAFIPRSSGFYRIALNTAVTVGVSFLWARGISRFSKMPAGFTFTYTKFAAAYSLVYFTANEVSFGVLRRFFHTTNPGINNLVSTSVALTLALGFPTALALPKKSLLLLHAWHILVYSLFFDMMACSVRDYLLQRRVDTFPEQLASERKAADQLAALLK